MNFPGTTKKFLTFTISSAGCLLWIAAIAWYAGHGFHPLMALAWLLAIALVGISFWKRRVAADIVHFDLRDCIIIASLLVAFAPLYLAAVQTIPYQMHTDEILELQLTRASSPDPFGLTHYAGIPNLHFLFMSTAARWLGGISFAHIRMASAATGLGIIALSYIFFRRLQNSFAGWILPAFSPRLMAAAGAILIGTNHAFLIISRSLGRMNEALLLGLLATLVAYLAGKRRDPWLAFVAGATMGLGWYVYYSARLVSAFLVAYGLWVCIRHAWKNSPTFHRTIRLAASLLTGFLLVATPLAIQTWQARNTTDMLLVQRQQLLIFPEGRIKAEGRMGAENQMQAWRKNIANGVMAFNSRMADQSRNYPDVGQGFGDPFTGMFLWLGLIVLVFGSTAEGRFMAAGFLSLLGLFSFVITQAPDFPRLLVVLPFAAYLTIAGVAWLSERAAGMVPAGRIRARLQAGFFVAGIAAVAITNLAMARSVALDGIRRGDLLGASARYVEARSTDAARAFYVAAGPEHPYYVWGSAWPLEVLAPVRTRGVIPPQSLTSLALSKPTSILMQKAVWDQYGPAFEKIHPNARVVSLLPDGSAVAVEIP